MCLSHFLFFCAIFAIAVGKNDIYKGNKVYNVKFTTQGQQDNLFRLKNDIIDFWRIPSYRNNIVGRVMVPSSQMDWFEEALSEMGVNIDVYIDDVYEYLIEKDDSVKFLSRNENTRNFGFDGYYRYDEILNYLYTLQDFNTTNTIEVVEYGSTVQNRPLVYVKISSASATEKPVVIVEGGINPREWITIPSAINVIDTLIGADYSRFLDAFDWIVIPVLNPDGYEYTHTDVRLWTKTLSTNSNLGFICPGVNVNRNFNIDWLVSDSSSSPCSHLYAGVEPFSEIESQLVQSLIEEYSSKIRLYISLQNNGGFISYPWQYERAASGMFRQHHLLGLDMISAIGNAEYFLGVGSLTLDDRASGTSTDFVQRSGILYSFNLNIMQDDSDGVIVPVEDIENAVSSVWRAIVVAADTLM